MDKQEFSRNVPLVPSDNVVTFNLSPGYNQYYKLYASEAVHTCYEEDLLIQEPDMVSDDEDYQLTLRAKDNIIDRTWT